MNREWADLCTLKQNQISKKETFEEGIQNLLSLRKILMKQWKQFRKEVRDEDFAAMPFPNVKDYRNKTIAYSMFHVFRIEDIVTNTIIRKKEEIFFAGDYQKKMNSSIITTGNELTGEEIVAFSANLELNELYRYLEEVDASTTKLIKTFTFQDMKRKMTEEDKKRVRALQVVSEEPCAEWLVNYWCDKNIRGLVQTPLSRHWLMHIEPCEKMVEKINKSRR